MLGAGALTVVAGLAPPSLAGAALATTFSDDFTDVGDGQLDGRRAPTGHRWTAYGADRDPPMVISGRAIGPPPGYARAVPSGPIDHNPSAGAGYGVVDMGGTVTRLGCDYRWDRSTSTASALGVGAFDYPAGVPDPYSAFGANLHLAITPTSLRFAAFTNLGLDFTVLTPAGHTSGIVSPQVTQVRDGQTTFRVDISRSADSATVAVTGFPTVRYRDPRIASVPARWPFFEYYSTEGGTNLPRITRVSASR